MSIRSKVAWYREPGDPTVGIFGDTWSHEACPVETDDPQQCIESTEVVGTEGEGIDRFDLVRLTITCQDCAASYVVTQKEWNPDYPEDVEP